jgi:hypothetical protein
MEVPDGAMIDSGTVGNVTSTRLHGNVILIKIDEYPRGSLGLTSFVTGIIDEPGGPYRALFISPPGSTMISILQFCCNQ